MVNALKLKTKIFNKVINKLGSNLIITPYTKGTRDAFGVSTETARTPTTIIAVEFEPIKNMIKYNPVPLQTGEISLFVDPDIILDDTPTTKYRFTWFGKEYEHSGRGSEIVGSLQNIQIVKVIYLKEV
jgi:hypothetical protein